MRLIVNIVAACILAAPAGADDFVRWQADTKAQLDIAIRYEQRCPRARGEAYKAWVDRCIPPEAWWTLFHPRVLDGSVIELAGEIVVLANVLAPSGMAPECDEERRWGNTAMKFLRDRDLRWLEIKRLSIDPQGRVSALLRDKEGNDLGDLLVAAGWAVPAGHNRPEVWCYVPDGSALTP